MINYISNIPADLRSGGFSAMNYAALEAVSKVVTLNYIGPINPPVDTSAKLRSKVLRAVGGRGDFPTFSCERLDRIAREIDAKSVSEAKLDFFHGFTPWIHTRPARPYAAWSDCIFPDYIAIFHRPHFRMSDLDRIARSEAAWLKRAERVAFSSAWAADRAIAAYDLDPARIEVVGVCGDFLPPERDTYAGGRQFAFISTNFEAKGGRQVLRAFTQVAEAYPDATLVVVGDPPKAKVPGGVTVTGFLKKEDPDEYARLQRVFAQSRAIVNLSRSDTAPVLLIEAAYFGCPVISSRRFAIPEIVLDGTTGILIDGLEDVGSLAGALINLLEDDQAYRGMRKAAWAHSRSNLSRDRFEERMAAFLRSTLGGSA